MTDLEYLPRGRYSSGNLIHREYRRTKFRQPYRGWNLHGFGWEKGVERLEMVSSYLYVPVFRLRNPLFLPCQPLR